jgi:hypothetical protein
VQGSLPAGRLAFTGWELNPLDRYERFQFVLTIIPPSCSPDASAIKQLRPTFTVATRRAGERRARGPYAVAARYDRRRDRVVVNLNTGLELAFPPRMAQGLEHSKPADLAEVELSPSGFGIHFPKLDAHLYLPALIQGVFGSKAWMAAQRGAARGRSRSPAKAAAARANANRGGRPRKLGAA